MVVENGGTVVGLARNTHPILEHLVLGRDVRHCYLLFDLIDRGAFGEAELYGEVAEDW